jgi:hypothetical protein
MLLFFSKGKNLVALTLVTVKVSLKKEIFQFLNSPNTKGSTLVAVLRLGLLVLNTVSDVK